MPSFTSLRVALGSIAGRYGLTTKLLEQRLARAWPDIAGSQIAAHARPDSIRYKKLYVLADSSVWVQQLSFLKPTLIPRINEAVGQDAVTDIIFRVGEIGAVRAASARDPHRAATPIQPSADVLADAASHASTIKDDDLRKRFTEVMARAITNGRSGRSPGP